MRTGLVVVLKHAVLGSLVAILQPSVTRLAFLSFKSVRTCLVVVLKHAVLSSLVAILQSSVTRLAVLSFIYLFLLNTNLFFVDTGFPTEVSQPFVHQ